MSRAHRPAPRHPILAAALTALVLPAVAETPTPASLIGKMKQALGGQAAIDAVRSMAVESACSAPDARFTTQVHSVRGGGSYIRQVARDQETEIWSTDEATWTVDENGVRRTLPASTRSFVRGHEFHLLILELEERFTDLRLAGSEPIGDRPAHKIEMTDEVGRPAAVWIDEESGLPVAMEMNPEGAAGSLRLTFDGWDTIDGVRLFRGFTLMEGADREFRYDYVAIHLNPAVVRAPAVTTVVATASDREAIEAILEADRQAHLKSDASILAAHLAAELFEVSDGEIRTQTREEIRSFFEGSFRGATFHAWEGTDPPVIRFSEDGTMAWVVRRVKADREDFPDGKSVRTRYTSAYTATYEKRAQGWRMTSVTSTFLPPAEES